MNAPFHFLALGPLGGFEIVVIAVLILLLFGAKKLPTFARSLGRSLTEFKRGKDESGKDQDDSDSTPPPGAKP